MGIVFRDHARGPNLGEVFADFWVKFLLIFILAYIIYAFKLLSVQNREKFDPGRRLFLPSLPLA